MPSKPPPCVASAAAGDSETPLRHAVTIVVATRDRRDAAVATVRRLRSLPGQPPVIVVDDGSSDGTADAVRDAFPDVQVLRPEGRRGVTTARNAGVEAATTPLVAFADDDSWWGPGSLDIAAHHFREHPRLGLLAAAILVGEEQRLDPTCEQMAASPLDGRGLPGPAILGFVACGAVVRRRAFLEVGGFPDDYVIGGEEEPVALAMAAKGWNLAYVDDVVAHHLPDTVPRDATGRMRRVTRNDLWTAWRFRRVAGALRRTLHIVAEARDPARLLGVADALLGLPRAAARRRPIPPAIEAQRRLLEQDGEGPPDPRLRAPAPGWVATAGRRRAARNHVRVLAHHIPPHRRSGDERVALVVITHNRAPELVDNLHRLAALPEQPRVVVVDNGSDDGTPEAVLDAHPWVELVVLDRNAGAVGRNVAAELLPHRYLAFADDDTWWESGSLRRAADVLDGHEMIAALTARIVVEPAGAEDPVVEDMRWSPLSDEPELPGHPLLSILAGASVVRRSAFLHVGGFEPRLWLGGEEELLCADLVAAGWKLRYLPELTVHHAPSRVRDPHRRRADGLRNTLWCTWLRRPLPRAAWRTGVLLRRAPRDRTTVAAVGRALRGVAWVLQERHALPPDVEREFRRLDAQQLSSRARRYVS